MIGAEIFMWVGIGWLLHVLYERWDSAVAAVDRAMRWLDRQLDDPPATAPRAPFEQHHHVKRISEGGER